MRNISQRVQIYENEMLDLAEKHGLDVAAEKNPEHPRNLEDETWTNIFKVLTSPPRNAPRLIPRKNEHASTFTVAWLLPCLCVDIAGGGEARPRVAPR